MANVMDKQSAAALKRSGWLKSVKNYFREYCHCSSIHGFRYFGERRTIIERVWWFFVFMSCLAGSVYSIYFVYIKWDNSPVIVTFATRGTPLYNIPYPSVTVCPATKAMRDKFNFTAILHKKLNGQLTTAKESKRLHHMSLVCSYNNPKIDDDYDTSSFDDDETIFEFLDSVSPDFSIRNCRLFGREEDCKDLFTPIITDEGICYTFNMLGRNEIFRESVVHFKDYHAVGHSSTNWTLDEGYANVIDFGTYPRPALLAGARNAFSFTIETKKSDIDYACENYYEGHKVLLHTAMRLPRPSQEFIQIPSDQAIVGIIHPKMITTSNSVKVYNPKRRECYFTFERHLKFFKIYSSLNCQMECLTNFTKDMCDCVNFFMPRENDTNICGFSDLDCIIMTEKLMDYVNLGNRLTVGDGKIKSFYSEVAEILSDAPDCDCMPICTDLTYDVETSQTDFNWKEQFEATKTEGNWSKDPIHMSSLTLFFKSNHFIPSQRNELYGPIDFLANFGGLLGLFTGFSVLSLMEIIYFCTVRLCCNSRLYGYWAGPEN